MLSSSLSPTCDPRGTALRAGRGRAGSAAAEAETRCRGGKVAGRGAPRHLPAPCGVGAYSPGKGGAGAKQTHQLPHKGARGPGTCTPAGHGSQRPSPATPGRCTPVGAARLPAAGRGDGPRAWSRPARSRWTTPKGRGSGSTCRKGGLRRLWGCRREVRQNYKNYKQVQWPAHSKPSSKVCCTKGADFGLMLEPTVT